MRTACLSLVILLGLLTAAVSAHFLWQDWAALRTAYARFETLAARGADLRALFVAEAQQNVFRVNCFADGVGVLLGAILAAIGVHGLCVVRPGAPPAARGEARDRPGSA